MFGQNQPTKLAITVQNSAHLYCTATVLTHELTVLSPGLHQVSLQLQSIPDSVLRVTTFSQ